MELIMLSAYPACFYKEKEGGYSVIFPDLNHLATCGDNLDDALQMAIDCLAGYLYTLKLENEKYPQPSEIINIDLSSEYDENNFIEAFINIVTVDVDEYAKKYFNKAVKKTLTIPKWLNDIAESKNINFSKTLQNALIELLNIKNKT